MATLDDVEGLPPRQCEAATTMLAVVKSWECYDLPTSAHKSFPSVIALARQHQK
jgi:hypothetical protein